MSKTKHEVEQELKITDKTSGYPNINYIWVGPSPSQKTGGIPGHDITGPIKMAACNKRNPIFFWCLEQYQQFYKEQFSAYPNINVNSIEGYIEKTIEIPEHNESATEIKRMLGYLLGNNSIRDRVTAKEAMMLFLLRNEGGYVVDTNVLPNDTKQTLDLPFYERFHVPVIEEQDDFNVDMLGKTGAISLKKASQKKSKTPAIDCWMMFSPKNDLTAKKILNHFLTGITSLESLRNPKSLEVYYLDVGNVIIESIEKEKDSLAVWHCPYYTYSSTFVDIDDLDLRKAYFNSHKYRSRFLYDPKFFGKDEKEQQNEEFDIVFHLSAAGDTTFLNSLLLSDKDRVHKKIETMEDRLIFDGSSTFVFNGETPLHLAVRKGRIKCIAILLENGANLDSEANYPQPYNNLSVRALMQLPGVYQQQYQAILEEYDHKPADPLKFI